MRWRSPVLRRGRRTVGDLEAGSRRPALPPGWAQSVSTGGVERPAWRSRWRLIPVVLIVAVLLIAVVQGLRPSGSQAHKEAHATAALLHKCLAQDGTANGHPKYSATPVACDSSTAAVRVVEVVPSIPGSPVCPAVPPGWSSVSRGALSPHSLHRAGLISPVTAPGTRGRLC